MEDRDCRAAKGDYRKYIAEDRKCVIKTGSYKDRIFSEMICGEPKKPRSGAGDPTSICKGDSGGPYTVKPDDQQPQHFLVGVSSWIFGCTEVIVKTTTQP